MKPSDLSIKDWWSDDVQKWFIAAYSGTDLAYLGLPPRKVSPRAKDRLCRLAVHKSMEPVAKALYRQSINPQLKPGKNAEMIARIGDQLFNDLDYDIESPPKPKDVVFMESVFELPDLWEYQRNNRPTVVAENYRILENECRKLLSLLEIERQNIEYLFFRNSPHSTLHEAKEKFSTLARTLQEIRRAIRNGHYHDAALIKFAQNLPVKLQQKGSREVFAARNLSHLAKELFGKPLYSAVAAAITVSFDLKIEVSQERVKDLLRKRSKKGGDRPKKNR